MDAILTPRELIRIIYENVSFPPATANKRFIQDMMARPDDAPISDRAERYAWRIAYYFRRQLPREIAEESVRRKVDHKWEQCDPKGYAGSPDFRCLVCGYYLTSKREQNAPCGGPKLPTSLRSKDGRERHLDAGCPEAQVRQSGVSENRMNEQRGGMK